MAKAFGFVSTSSDIESLLFPLIVKFNKNNHHPARFE
jgi:hypothetical protein